MKILVTGGAGFIGSAVVRRAVAEGYSVVNVDALTYAGDLAKVAGVEDSARYAFEYADICDAEAMATIFERHRPDAVLHLAAESHVDRSIDGPLAFVQTNITGTAVMLETARAWHELMPDSARGRFRFHHVSTDEVFGALGDTGVFDEETPYNPSSPYSASKASADMLVRAWGTTFGLPVVVTNTSNNYGPWQHPEKLIPTVIAAALEGRPIPVYGKGAQVRDWLYVEDHADALLRVLARGRLGETYCIGGEAERTNLEMVRMICAAIDKARPRTWPHAELIKFVEDRPGHDHRYAISNAKIAAELGWRPWVGLEAGIARTVRWCLDNEAWLTARSGKAERLGLRAAGVSRKGMILAGGAGTRLHPLTMAVSKQLLPVYNKPMIFYPLSVLMLAGVREIAVITTPQDQGAFQRLLGDGSQIGLDLTWLVQPEPGGLSQAYLIGEDFLAGDPSMLVLGDNIFYGGGFRPMLQAAAERTEGATVFGYPVADPGRYGVVAFDAEGRVTSLEEKPAQPKSNVAVTGLYFFDGRASAFAREQKPSARGELEIVDLIRRYLDLDALTVQNLGRGFAWLDTGTHEALIQAGEFVRTIEERQGLRLGCLEEIAFQNHWIDKAQLRSLAKAAGPYGAYLDAIADGAT